MSASSRHRPAAVGHRPAHALQQFVRFGLRQAVSCAFAVALIAGIGLSKLLPDLPVARYDLLFAYGILLSALFRLAGWESARDLLVIAGCHLLGLVFEYVKVALGSWSYPEPALLKFGGVPLYGGFMYAAVGSYICAVWRQLGLRLTGYLPVPTAVVAAALYVNFISHHWLPDLRWPLAALLTLVTARARVNYTVGKHTYWMPMPLSFALIGFFLWLAENMATYVGAWRYPYQLDGWQPVSVDKVGAWALLVSILCVLGAAVHHPGGRRSRPTAGNPFARPGRRLSRCPACPPPPSPTNRIPGPTPTPGASRAGSSAASASAPSRP